MNKIDIHRAWAPPEGGWSRWVKAVLFAHLDAATIARGSATPNGEAPPWLEPEVVAPLAAGRSSPYREGDRPLHDVAVIVDHPSVDGLALGVALAAHGFRPVPLYNAIPSSLGLVNLAPLQHALVASAMRLGALPNDAPPVFLLDALREGEGWALPGRFDNRSRCSIHDFPSVEQLRGAGISRALLLSDELRDDVEPIALAWQASGIALWRKRPSERAPAAPFALRAPSIFQRLWRAVARPVFRPNADDTYGRLIESRSGG